MCRATDKRKKRGPEAEPLVAVSLLEGGQGNGAQVLGSTPNADAWRSGRMLRVGEQVFQVVVNPPSVLKARTEQRSFSGSNSFAQSLSPHSPYHGRCSACQFLSADPQPRRAVLVPHILSRHMGEGHRIVLQAEVHGLPMVGYPLLPYIAVSSPTM